MWNQYPGAFHTHQQRMELKEIFFLERVRADGFQLSDITRAIWFDGSKDYNFLRMMTAKRYSMTVIILP